MKTTIEQKDLNITIIDPECGGSIELYTLKGQSPPSLTIFVQGDCGNIQIDVSPGQVDQLIAGLQQMRAVMK